MLTTLEKLEIVVIAFGTGLALWASANPQLFALGGTLAGVAALGLGGSMLLERMRALPPVARPDTQTLVVLRESFGSTSLGRQNVVAALATLDRELRGRSRPTITPEEERRLAGVGRLEFRRWVEERLAELERET